MLQIPGSCPLSRVYAWHYYKGVKKEAHPSSQVRSSLLALTLALGTWYVSHRLDKFSKFAPS